MPPCPMNPCCAGCQLCIHATDFCLGTNLAGVFTVKQGGVTIGTCTTTTSGLTPGQCCVTIPATGSYDWTFVPTLTTYLSKSGTVSVTCPGTTTINVTFLKKANVTLGGHVDGCTGVCFGGSGIQRTFPYDVTITGPESGSTSGTANGGVGDWSFVVGTAGTYTVVISDPSGRYAPQTLTFTLVDLCHGVTPQNVVLAPAAGFACMRWTCCAYPWKTTLHLVDAVYGACTLTYNPSLPGSGLPGWQGTITTTHCNPGCAGGSITITYTMFANSGFGANPFSASAVTTTGPCVGTQSIGPVPIVNSCPPGGEIDYTLHSWVCTGLSPTTTGTIVE